MQPAHFESRELKPYAEPVSASALKEGVIYFFVTFSDDAMLLPTMEPVVFIGRNLDANDAGVVYFQDIDSYQQGVRYCTPVENKNENATIYSGSENETGHVFEYEQALEELMRCALRRRTIGER
jgi:hypothetical protein